MRFLICIVIGLVAGAFLAATAGKTLGMRSAHARASMVVLAHHADALRDLHQDVQCTGEAAAQRWQQLRMAAREIDYAFADLVAQDGQFRRRNQQLRRVVDLEYDTITDCQTLATRLGELAQTCQACHRDYR